MPNDERPLKSSAVPPPLPKRFPARPAKSSGGIPPWAIILMACAGASIPVIAIMAGLLLPALAKAKQKAYIIRCANNLKQVGLTLRMWKNKHGQEFIFNITTNSGGTLEWCEPGEDGLDKNSWRHFQALSNSMFSPAVLICPLDKTLKIATDFNHLDAMNVTYLIHSGTNVNDANPTAILAICPIHHNILFADGSVQIVKATVMQKYMQSISQSQK